MTFNFGTGSTPTIASPNTQLANGSPLSAGGGQAEGAATGPLEGPGSDAFSSNHEPSSPSSDLAGSAPVHLLGVTFVGASGLLPLLNPTLAPFGWATDGPSSGSGHDNDHVFLPIPASGRAEPLSGGYDYFWLMHPSHSLAGPNVNDSLDGSSAQDDLDAGSA
jgi:hypothetical protein